MLITVIGAAVALLGISTHLSFRYWKAEVVATAEQQALLAASSVRSAVESGLQSGRQEQARRALRQLVDHPPVQHVRVYGGDGSILISTDLAEEGRRPTGVWLPPVREFEPSGAVRVEPSRDIVRAFVPVRAPPGVLLEVEYSLGPIKAAMDRGARLGMGLVIGSVFGLAAILFTMLEREVVGPLARMSDMLPAESPGRNELQKLESGVVRLLEKEQEVEHLAAEQRQQLAQQAGLAQVGEMAAEMAHEFKRPLASIQSAVHLLAQEYVLEQRGQTLLSAVESQLGHLSETMQDLFSLAKPVGLELEPVPLRDVADRALGQLAGHPAAAGLDVKLDYDASDIVVHGDARRLEQVVANLLLNGAEAMAGGGVLRLRLGGTEGAGWLEVEDTGAGIPESELEKVMLPFYSTKPSGTGLGLPLVARVVSAHQGRLSIDSSPGRGTRVRIELPRAPVPAGVAI
ncbi:MAG TPA: HAMP domain-containing sensor histidine kinase [Longimicrobiales bacterium]|nr:HAMP domain-containing sensor histidine kinase [Longimicrobiales bacterium]